MYAILAPVRLKPGMRNTFMKKLGDHAVRSRKEEPGCLRFDVIQDGNRPDVVWFYEVYTDEQAFEEHKQTDHYGPWIKLAGTMIAEMLPGGFEGGETVYPTEADWS